MHDLSFDDLLRAKEKQRQRELVWMKIQNIARSNPNVGSSLAARSRFSFIFFSILIFLIILTFSTFIPIFISFFQVHLEHLQLAVQPSEESIE